MTNAGHDGIDILQNACIFNAGNVATASAAQVFVAEQRSELLGLRQVGASNSQIRKPFESDFLGMTRAADNDDIFIRNIEITV